MVREANPPTIMASSRWSTMCLRCYSNSIASSCYTLLYFFCRLRLLQELQRTISTVCLSFPPSSPPLLLCHFTERKSTFVLKSKKTQLGLNFFIYQLLRGSTRVDDSPHFIGYAAHIQLTFGFRNLDSHNNSYFHQILMHTITQMWCKFYSKEIHFTRPLGLLETPKAKQNTQSMRTRDL